MKEIKCPKCGKTTGISLINGPYFYGSGFVEFNNRCKCGHEFCSLYGLNECKDKAGPTGWKP